MYQDVVHFLSAISNNTLLHVHSPKRSVMYCLHKTYFVAGLGCCTLLYRRWARWVFSFPERQSVSWREQSTTGTIVGPWSLQCRSRKVNAVRGARNEWCCDDDLTYCNRQSRNHLLDSYAGSSVLFLVFLENRYWPNTRAVDSFRMMLLMFQHLFDSFQMSCGETGTSEDATTTS